MFESGAYVAERIDPIESEQVQPNGVDLTLEAVFEQVEPGRIGQEGKQIGEREAVEADDCVGGGDAVATDDHVGEGDAVATDDHVGEGDVVATDDGTYVLDTGGYIVRYGETIAIPDEHVGFVYPRSSLLRNSCMLNTAVWDAGYEGKGEGLLQVHHPIEIEKGARIAQLVLARAEHETIYDGSYQGENL